MRITIMGLGLHGGGLASARYFLSKGARLTVTDLRDEETLRPSIKPLEGEDVRFVLGRHEIEDFSTADMVIKNPAVPASSPYLAAAQRVESDISVFLRINRRPIIAVTGSKGKSTIVSAIYHAAKQSYPNALLGGNITVSPLSFAGKAEVPSRDPVILELSSWQLGDLKGKGLLSPEISVVSNIMHDHQNAYPNMEAYMADKAVIFESQKADTFTILNLEDPRHDYFLQRSPAQPRFFSSKALPPGKRGAWLTEDGRGYMHIDDNKEAEEILPQRLALAGQHNRVNLLTAALSLRLFGMDTVSIRSGLQDFPGIPHRMELVAEKQRVRWYNDSAATIPEATAGAVESFPDELILLCGGTDKELVFEELLDCIDKPKQLHLLSGSASERLIIELKQRKIPFYGPYQSLKTAVERISQLASPGDTVLFSPGATSFGMFLNEFDRGNQFKELVKGL